MISPVCFPFALVVHTLTISAVFMPLLSNAEPSFNFSRLGVSLGVLLLAFRGFERRFRDHKTQHTLHNVPHPPTAVGIRSFFLSVLQEGW